MAADLFETYAVTVVATMVLASIFFSGNETMMIYPLAICGACVVTPILEHILLNLEKVTQLWVLYIKVSSQLQYYH